MSEDEKQRCAKERGETIRAALVEQLAIGPGTAADLLPQLSVSNVSLSEVVFQLGRLKEEGRVIDEQGGLYRLS